MAAASTTTLLVLCVCLAAGAVTGIQAASTRMAPPGASPLVVACSEGPFPQRCVHELGPRLLDVQTALASASPRGALIAGAPGQVDFASLLSVAMEAATEAGAVATAIFDGKVPGFNKAVPDFKVCLDNCSVTMKAAMKKVHGATAALKAGANDVAKTLLTKSITDVSSCTGACKGLSGDVQLIMQASLVEFQKMLKIAVTFIDKLKTKTPPGPPPVRRP